MLLNVLSLPVLDLLGDALTFIGPWPPPWPLVTPWGDHQLVHSLEVIMTLLIHRQLLTAGLVGSQEVASLEWSCNINKRKLKNLQHCSNQSINAKINIMNETTINIILWFYCWLDLVAQLNKGLNYLRVAWRSSLIFSIIFFILASMSTCLW